MAVRPDLGAHPSCRCGTHYLLKTEKMAPFSYNYSQAKSAKKYLLDIYVKLYMLETRQICLCNSRS